MMSDDRHSALPAPSRRSLLVSGVVAATAFALPESSSAANTGGRSQRSSQDTVVARDGTRIFYKDWGAGRPIVFSHGWPLSADAWDAQLLFMAAQGYRVVAHDRRGHGRSGQPSSGNDMDTYADDLATLVDQLDLKDILLVGHSAGGAECVRYLSRHGSRRVAQLVLTSAVPPHLAKSAGNPDGADLAIFDGLRAALASDRSQFYKDLSAPFFGINRPGAKPLTGLRDAFWLQGMAGSEKAHHDCIKQFSEIDFTRDLDMVGVPTLIIHGDDDQIVPLAISSAITARLLKRATLKIYPGAPHGLPMTHQSQFNADLSDFAKTR